MTGNQALNKLAEEVKNVDATAILKCGEKFLSDSADQEAIVGSVKVG